TNDTDGASPGATQQAQAATIMTAGHDSYIYVGKGQDSKSPAEAILLYELPANHAGDGSNFLYADGHVTFEVKRAAQAMINELNAGHNPPHDEVVRKAVSGNGP